MVLETTWRRAPAGSSSATSSRIGPWHHDAERSDSHRRAPTDYEADHVIVRTVECVQGSVELNLECEPAFDYGGAGGRVGATRAGATRGDRARRRAWTSTLPLATRPAPRLRGRRAPARARRCARARSRSSRWAGRPSARCRARTRRPTGGCDGTAHYWQEWLQARHVPRPPAGARYLQRSALTLKGLTYAPTGALVAAATTSLPETPGGERNWDYRYSWLRDSDLHAVGAVHARLRLGGRRLLLLRRRPGGGRGRRAADHVRDRRRDRARGAGARPTCRATTARGRCASATAPTTSEQHDVWGAVLDSIYLHTRSRDQLPERVWPIVKRQVETARRRTGASPTAGSGRCAASRSTSRRRRSCAGWPPTAARGWPQLRDEPDARGALAGGRRRDPRRRLRERASTSAACSRSTTTPTRSTPRCC